MIFVQKRFTLLYTIDSCHDSVLDSALTRLMLCRAKFQLTSGTAKPLEDKLRNVKRAISSTARRFSGSQQHVSTSVKQVFFF